jgi:hypothetical protein
VTSPTADISSGRRVESPAHWVQLFADAFGAGQYEAVARLEEYTHPDYLAVQPRTPDAVGPAGLLDLFARVYALVPDLRGEVLQANVYEGGVYIEVRLSGTLGGRPVTWDACDRFWFQDGLVRGRVSYMDPLVLLERVASRPRAWRRWWRSGLGPPTRHISKRLDGRGRYLNDRGTR